MAGHPSAWCCITGSPGWSDESNGFRAPRQHQRLPTSLLTSIPGDVPRLHLRTPQRIPVQRHIPTAAPTPGTASCTLPICKPILTALIITALIVQLSQLSLIRSVRSGTRCHSNINEGWRSPPRRRLTPGAVSGTRSTAGPQPRALWIDPGQVPTEHTELSPEAPRSFPGRAAHPKPPIVRHLGFSVPFHAKADSRRWKCPASLDQSRVGCRHSGALLVSSSGAPRGQMAQGLSGSCISTRVVLTWFCNGALNCGDRSVGTAGTHWYNGRGHRGRSHGCGSSRDALWQWQWSHHEHPWVLPWLPGIPTGEMLWGRGSAPLLSPLPAPAPFALPRAVSSSHESSSFGRGNE